MATLTVTLTITARALQWTSNLLVFIFTFLRTVQSQLSSIPNTTGQFVCGWDDHNNLQASITLTQTSATDFTETQLNAINTWIQNNVVTIIPSYCNIVRNNSWTP